MSKYLNLFVTETYTPNGSEEEKTKYHRVGTAFPHEKGDGFNIEFTPGICVSGKAVAFPPQEEDSKS